MDPCKLLIFKTSECIVQNDSFASKIQEMRKKDGVGFQCIKFYFFYKTFSSSKKLLIFNITIRILICFKFVFYTLFNCFAHIVNGIRYFEISRGNSFDYLFSFLMLGLPSEPDGALIALSLSSNLNESIIVRSIPNFLDISK